MGDSMKTSNSLRDKMISLMFAAGLVISFLPDAAHGEVVSQQLESITNGMLAPEDVAISPDGKVYAVDAAAGKVLIFNANNQLLDSLAIDLPVAVAVGVSGYKYVATNNKFHVKILNGADKVINYLGNGFNEFLLPRNIAVDSATGKVYVVDQLDNSIKVYTATGNFVKKISDANNQPIDLTVWGNELYVLDQPLVTDSSNGLMRGARVAVFDKVTGSFIRSFGTFGPGAGQLAKPKGITVDSQGVLYVADSFHGVVQCFDKNGTYLGAVQNTRAGEAMSTPQGVAVTTSGKMYVATTDSNDPPGLKIFGVNRPLVAGADLLVSPAAITFGSVNVGASSATRTITLTSNGTEALVLGSLSLAGADAGIYSVVADGCSGRSLVGLSACTVELLVTPMSEGEKNASLLIPSNDSDLPTAALALSATGVGTPAIVVTPTVLDLGFVAIGETSPARLLTIQNTGSTALAVSGITAGGFYSGEFLVVADNCTGNSVAPAASCTFGVSFVPIVEGNRTASLTIQSNDTARPSLVVAVSGKGYGYPDIKVSALNLDFGVIPVGTVSAIRTVTLANQGTVGLFVGRIEKQGANPADFLIASTCADRVLPAGGSCEIKVTLYPATTEGNKTAKLIVSSNDPDQGEIMVSLKGAASITPIVALPGPLPKSGRWVSVSIELPAGFSIDEIDTSTVVLHRVNGVEIEPPISTSGPVEIGDYNRNGVADLMVKFNRQELFSLLNPGNSIITVSGELSDGTLFEQSSAITYNGN
jgi:DNA-binding beta-propeller fold protein YncE